MPRLIQFQTADKTIQAQLKGLILQQINAWSRLQTLADDPGRITQPWNDSIFFETAPGLIQLNYDDVYNNLGDDGRVIADTLIGMGVLIGKSLIPGFPPLELVTGELPIGDPP